MVAQLYEQYNRLMLHIAHGILADVSLAEDAVSESLVKMMRHQEKFQQMECHQIKAYIVNIVRTTAYDMNKQHSKNTHEPKELLEDIADNNADLLHDLTAKEGYASILNAILSLPDKLRDAAYFFLVHGMTHEEVARACDISVNASKKRIFRAKARIKEIIGGRGGEHE